ncbi:glycosyltransferase family 1 protein [Fusobacterium varium]|nr:glycosyltransferase family 1 protein [Fusobacterium varium]
MKKIKIYITKKYLKIFKTIFLLIKLKFVLYLGALEPRKNIPNIILGFSKYKEEKVDSDIKLVIAGKKAWQYENIFKTYELSKYKKDIIFTDYIDEKDKIILYKMAKLFIFPSLYEGFGMPVLEAMASGTPVITSNNSSLTEVVGEAGILVNPDSVEEISKAIAKILDGEEDYINDLIAKGKEQAKKFTWENSTKLLEDIYEMM